MEKELVDIVIHKSFIELSKDERIMLSEWCTSEEEYDQLKNVFMEMERIKLSQKETVRPHTKKSLDVLFFEKQQKAPVFWNNSVMTLIYPVDKSMHRRPLVQIAAAALLFLFAYPLVNTNGLEESKILTAKNEEIRDSTKQQNVNQVKDTVANSVVANDLLQSKQAVKMKAPVLEAKNELSASARNVEVSAFTSFISSDSDLSRSDADTDGVFELNDSNHPDGVFNGEIISAFSEPVSADPGVLDLLAVTF